MKIGVLHAERAGVEVFSGEYVPTSLVAQGMTGFFAGRPRPAPVFRVIHLLVDKGVAEPRVTLAGEDVPLTLIAGRPGREAGHAGARRADRGAAVGGPAQGAAQTPRLRAQRRQGQPRQHRPDRPPAGVRARPIAAQVTAERVEEFFAHNLRDDAEVKRWAMPGLDAINIIMTQVLGGTGGTSTLRYDPQAKSYAAMLLTMPIEIDADVAALLEAAR